MDAVRHNIRWVERAASESGEIPLRRRPPVTPAPKTAGRTGSTQGESAVAAPARSANAIKRTIAVESRPGA